MYINVWRVQDAIVKITCGKSSWVKNGEEIFTKSVGPTYLLDVENPDLFARGCGLVKCAATPELKLSLTQNGEVECVEVDSPIVGRGISVLEAVGCWSVYSEMVKLQKSPLIDERFELHFKGCDRR